jgi:predicted RNA-binding protein with PUA-like domain
MPEKTRRETPADASPSQFFTKEGGPWGRCFLPRRPGEKRYWLVKSEPDVFSWDDLLKAKKRTTHWNGVRNFSARNFMRDGMKMGDLVFFYHSNAEPPGIVGICEVAREAYPDTTAFDQDHDGYDEKSSPANPTWFMVDLRAVEPLPNMVTLPMLKSAKGLEQMALIRTGRLSVIPVTADEWKTILALARG